MPVVCTFEQRASVNRASAKALLRDYRICSNRGYLSLSLSLFSLPLQPSEGWKAENEGGGLITTGTTVGKSLGGEGVGESKNMHKYAGAQRLHVDGIGDGR